MNEQEGSVRIGPVSMFTLIAVICLAVLAVLAITTANASYNMAKLQADSMKEQYVAEIAAQDFVALADSQINQSQGTGSSRVAAFNASLDSTVARIQEEAGNGVTVAAQTQDNRIMAQFTCKNGRMLDVVLKVEDSGSYEIAQWDMTATRNDAQAENLWSGM